MRKINTRDFHRATRSTPREINRQIVLNLIREHQPISRADLARRMDVHRSHLTPLVRELVSAGTVYEKGAPVVVRGRRPTLLYVRTSGRLAVAVDVRPEHTTVALADFAGTTVARDVFVTPATPHSLADQLAARVERLVRLRAESGAAGGESACLGVGLVVPGMVDRRTGRVLYAPRLGWRDVDLRDAVRARLRLPVYVESAPIACALARLWLSPGDTAGVHSFAYVSVSDGVGVGLVLNGDALRGEAHTAGEFGHVTIDPHGPPCVCGKRGCWEAFTCNAATVTRYVERVLRRRAADAARDVARGVPAGRAIERVELGLAHPPTIEDVVARARRGEAEAVAAIAETGWYIGLGLAAVAGAFNPGRIYVGGEITAAWELLEGPIRQALAEQTLTEAARGTSVVPDRRPGEYRLLGAVALVAAPTFAAPAVG
jgi:predicted NBD/HSP70 family sugar kinase